MLKFNKILDGGGLFAYFQYISGDIVRFYKLGRIEMNPIIKGGKQFALKLYYMS